MSWASKRKTLYVSIVLGIIIIIIFAFIYPVIFKEPTCRDGKQNGSETGIDCGGACSLVCKEESRDPVVLWSRAFPVIDGNYNFVALVENKNRDASLMEVSYEFKAYDSSNKFIGRREGKTFLPPNERFAIFEPRFKALDGEIKTVSFEFVPPYVWFKKEPKIQSLPIKVDNITLENESISPLLRARVVNDSNYDLPSFSVVAIVYNIDGNAINVSKTVKNGIKSGESIEVYFTWPVPFLETVVSFDVLPLFDPFTLPF
ncbi:TPA: hypothetical protein DIC38_02530 [Candidatus Nomurabacteria bacterium]|nr:MAG: hypothetical protein O210_OD1C00001G0012 [Parcubacteria bacterium RAAC4_OD1_1]HCY26529.1 hypothetical protein [Candidatus Nomurabacteria bacterium]